MKLQLPLFDPSWPSQEEVKQRSAGCGCAPGTEAPDEIGDNTADSTLKQLSKFTLERVKNIFPFDSRKLSAIL